MSDQANEFHTFNQNVYGGVGGQGGEGGLQGGSGGPGEGPTMSYDVKAEHFIVNNMYIQVVQPDSAQMGHPTSGPDDHNYRIIRDHLRDVMLAQEYTPLGLAELLPILPDNLNVADLRSTRDDASTYVTFMNHSSMEVTLCWINYDGNPIKYWTIGTGEEVKQQTFISHPWIAYCSTGIIAIFFPLSRHSKAIIRLPGELRQFPPETEENLHSGESIISTFVTFVNKTHQTVTGDWIDREGNPINYWTLQAGEEIRQPTYVSHPWVIRDSNSRTIGVFLPRRTESKAVIHLRRSKV
ncbi:von Hippel-Lindau disease tumor suppressor, beta/alpha domain-containing protein [Mycena alexandri]|uniref:von Hippel-Lindau disease tumor suppressor, beta/alpha domain-containing protein n=1 Tax=Mycena alexandri TaxID=1745969 RepID=A0AAD6SVQ2_9AGAR|nr:von Hippel-Lindau disease tumor suppressor, beta/alpha domain-containing protein [Mycena alexandri]